MSAHVEGSGTGVKFRKMSVAEPESEKLPPPSPFVNDPVFSVKSLALNPETVGAESSVHW